MKIAFVLISLIIYVTASYKEPCQLPEKFHSRLHSLNFTKEDGEYCTNTFISSELYYDSPNQMLRHDLKFFQNEKETDKTYWVLYDEGVSYVINWNQQTCVQHKLDNNKKLPHPKIPSGSTYEGKYAVGDGIVDSWKTPEKKGYIAYITISPTSCYPVNIMTLNATSHELKGIIGFFNFIPDVPPHMFELPEVCKRAMFLHGDHTPDFYPFICKMNHMLNSNLQMFISLYGTEETSRKLFKICTN